MHTIELDQETVDRLSYVLDEKVDHDELSRFDKQFVDKLLRDLPDIEYGAGVHPDDEVSKVD